MLYLIVKQVHVASVLLSFALFLFRGGLMFAESKWQKNLFVRVVPHVVDTVLLTTALWLMSMLRQYPFVHHWLSVKVILLALYIVLGNLALKRGRTKRERGVFFVLAVLVFLCIVSVARAHHPLGMFFTLFG